MCVNESVFIMLRQYVASSLAYDVALIKLAEPVTLTDDINVVCLPGSREYAALNSACVTTGWGRTDFGKPNWHIL